MNTNNIDKVLGQRVDSPTTYTPEILVREERQRALGQADREVLAQLIEKTASYQPRVMGLDVKIGRAHV